MSDIVTPQLPAIQFNTVSKNYNMVNALIKADFAIYPGEFVFLVGPSGAGKSTVLKLIYREEIATEGVVTINGIDLATLKENQVPLLRRGLGIVFQDFKLLEGQTTFDNVAYVLRALGTPADEVRRRVIGALKVVGLVDKIDSLPSELSGGEQQRVGVARAIVNGPAIVIADEPTGNLDPQSTLDIMNLLLQTNARGTTVLVSTHNLTMVEALRKRVIAIEEGHVVADGLYDPDASEPAPAPV
ncbi:MAG: cell division ATP-binding protein FtsE [Vampirovibrionales bacterium]